MGDGATSIIYHCYYDNVKYTGDAVGVNDCGTVGEDVVGKTYGQFNSGEVAWLLAQGCKVGETVYDGSVWGQQLGEDTYPVPGSPYKLITTAKKSEDNTYWATFSNQTSDVTLSVPSTRTLNVYNATVSAGTMTLSERYNDNQVAKGEGVLLKTDGEYVNVKTNETNILTKVDYTYNNLVATPAEAKTITADNDYTLYRLTYNKVSDYVGLGFYLSLVKDSNGNVVDSSVDKQLAASPGKAYLNVLTSETKLPSSTTYARSFAFPRDNGGTTGIGDIVIKGDAGINGSADGDGSIYDLQGRKVSKPTKGVYIKNNRLFLK